MQHPDELHHHDGDATQASERPDPADALRPFDPHVQVVTDDGQTIPLERQEDGSYAGVIPGRVVTSGYVLTPTADVVGDPAVQDDERREGPPRSRALAAANRLPLDATRASDMRRDLMRAVDLANQEGYGEPDHVQGYGPEDYARAVDATSTASVTHQGVRAGEPVTFDQLPEVHRDAEARRLADQHPAAAGAAPDDPRTAPPWVDPRFLVAADMRATILGAMEELDGKPYVEPVPPIVHRFRLHVFRSPAPTRLQQQVAGSEDGVLAAAIAQLPACPDEALRFNLLLDAMRDGLAPFARGRHAAQALVSGETAERWTEPMVLALLPAELVDGPTAEPNPRGRALAVALRLPLGDTRASQGLWSSKGCHWGAGMANVVVTDAATGQPLDGNPGDDMSTTGDLL